MMSKVNEVDLAELKTHDLQTWLTASIGTIDLWEKEQGGKLIDELKNARMKMAGALDWLQRAAIVLREGQAELDEILEDTNTLVEDSGGTTDGENTQPKGAADGGNTDEGRLAEDGNPLADSGKIDPTDS